MNTKRWQKEFDADYQVPIEITSNPQLEDISWHNDICPSFMLASAELDDKVTRIWVNHVNPTQREDINQKRFVVVSDIDYDGANIFFTNDVNEAIAELQKRNS